jgi:hypothetical protein
MGMKLCCFTLREGHRLSVFKNRLCRRIFGPKRDKVTGGRRKLHNEEIHSLYSAPNIIRIMKSRRMIWAGHVVCIGRVRNVYDILVGKPEGKIPLGRPRHRWDNIKMDLKEIGLKDVDWILDLGLRPVAGFCEHSNEPSGSTKGG